MTNQELAFLDAFHDMMSEAFVTVHDLNDSPGIRPTYMEDPDTLPETTPLLHSDLRAFVPGLRRGDIGLAGFDDDE